MRNAESRFAQNPQVNFSRSRFDRPSRVLFSGNVGDLIPFYCDEVLPGDTFDMRTAKVVRLQPLVSPPMDNLYLDTYYFFVPNRLLWDSWQEFQGENTSSPWAPSVNYQVPTIYSPSSTGWTKGTVADYLGIPIGVSGLEVNALPFRAYALIWNEWFRDQNTMDPALINTGSSSVYGTNSSCYAAPQYGQLGGLPFKACKLHDYFTSCLPAPQKGASVELPLFTQSWLPVLATDEHHSIEKLTSGNAQALSFSKGSGSVGDTVRSPISPSWYVALGATDVDSGDGIAPDNLWVGTSGFASSINQLRLAFQVQKALERDARGGTRYVEILKSHFGVTSPDARLQRPEYLGGNRLAINIAQVVQQSATVSGQTPQGNPAAISVTHDSHQDFTRSFTEHGFILGLCVARYPHTYQQGIERFWSRKIRFDYYMPVFANIGEQAVLNQEIYAQGSSVVDSDGNKIDEQVFGYQEAWADYRYKPSRTAGEMRSTYSAPLDSWHFGDDYSSLPMLSDSWMFEDLSPVDRALAIAHTVSDQFFADFYFDLKTTRTMPLYSIPGLIDHN